MATPVDTKAQAPLPPPLPWHGASEALIARSDNAWITPAEQNGFTETPNYEATRAWLERLAAATPLIHVETFGVSPQGRDLLVVTASETGALDPSEPTLLVQAGIHSGEIDGKDAGMMMLRDMAFGRLRPLLHRVNFVLIPILNVDGHERASVFNRPNQRGPSNQGWRNTAQNLNLNRDYAKLDAPEMRALIALIRRIHPDLYMDIHVTDGMDYQYDVTYTYQGAMGSYAASPHIARWLESTYRPHIDQTLRHNGHIPGDLIFAEDDRNPMAGLAGYPFSPRYSQSYGDMIHMASVLVENHSLKPYRQRVLGTYVLLEESLRLLADHGAPLRAASAADARERPAQIPAGWGQTDAPTSQRPFLPVELERYHSPASGVDEPRWLGRAAAPTHVPQYGVRATLSLTRPTAYWVPATKPDVINVLRMHGVQFETLTTARTVEVDMLRLPHAQASAALTEGRTRIDAGEPERLHRSEWMPAGSIRVPTDQPLGDLAVILLDPESEDSLFAWGFFNEILQRVEYIEGYAMAPLADQMLQSDAALRAEFEAKLASDPAFAANPDARLAWFYARTPYADERYQLYPVGIER
ncbi:MAG: M14 family metallopeptidase [Terricaulis silvestris]